MRDKVDYEKKIKREQHFMKLVENNSNNSEFCSKSINTLIIEILTRLTCKDETNKKYIDDMFSDSIHQYIYDLEILYRLKLML